ncbi:SAM-dependent methyltransferase [Rhodoblastus sphagnicola]|uniref:SAM-dependent methyltransferase n=1 Tax=Rhodoblastus sphagnicola TaxID=333368 RepID=A0A2S6N6T0_9HYPH|nr:class I SAM-dependent methyltransferase [Rhodoblastus sphagnicola]MBB4200981.1 SAM-dependent methyltransferase [Rhodoblastus sphagnicola]PPQ30332.1 SAM-dependent methyltransferase [Rhodoblastus sphagnicola]
MTDALHQFQTTCDQTGASPTADIRRIVADLGYPARWNWCWENYKPTVIELSRARGLRRHLEIGAGRDPLFQPDEATQLDLDITLNDISAHELSLAPSGYGKVLCDIAAPDAPDIVGRGAYDLAYCRMVMEHVPDVAAMWRNIGEALTPNGVALAFFPTLYALPYVMNRLIPEKLSRVLLETVFPERKPDGDDPKFPAHYDFCFSGEDRLMPMLRRAGFSNAVILPFWGYSYFSKFPILRDVDAAFNRLAERRDWRAASSFAYVVATK